MEMKQQKYMSLCWSRQAKVMQQLASLVGQSKMRRYSDALEPAQQTRVSGRLHGDDAVRIRAFGFVSYCWFQIIEPKRRR